MSNQNNMIKAVADTNVLISGTIQKTGIPATILDKYWRKGKLILITSPSLIAEIKRVIHYPHIMNKYNLSENDINSFIWELEHKTIITPEEIRLEVIKSDPTDDRVLEAAVEGEADYIISGDTKHLLPLKEYQGIKIIPPAEFVKILKK